MYHSSKLLASGQQMKKLYEAQLEEICRAYEITQTEADIIAFLGNNPEHDTARDIVEVRMIAKSYVSKSVERLIKKEYLVRVPDQKDRRIIHLKLTTDTIAIVEKVRVAQSAFKSILFDGLVTTEIEYFEATLDKIFNNVKAAYDALENDVYI